MATNYGCIRIPLANGRGRAVLAHRLAWALAHGTVPPEGEYICHRCDNPPCCNPAHLFAGTPGDNMRDAARKGRTGQQVSPSRYPRGSGHHQAKLTEADVRVLRARVAGGETIKALAREFGVSDTAVGDAVRRRWWRHVED